MSEEGDGLIARCERGCDPPRPATMLIRAGFEWHPCCDECGKWWPDHRKSYLATPQEAVDRIKALPEQVGLTEPDESDPEAVAYARGYRSGIAEARRGAGGMSCEEGVCWAEPLCEACDHWKAEAERLRLQIVALENAGMETAAQLGEAEGTLARIAAGHAHPSKLAGEALDRLASGEAEHDEEQAG